MNEQTPKCESCENPAVIMIFDAERCFNQSTGVVIHRRFGDAHYFCANHHRDSVYYDGPPIDWPL